MKQTDIQKLRDAGRINGNPHRIQTRLLPLVVAALAATSSGCITAHCVRGKAMSHETFDVETSADKFVPGRPGYYVLLPLTVAADLATAPFQLVYFMYSTRETSFQWVSIN